MQFYSLWRESEEGEERRSTESFYTSFLFAHFDKYFLERNYSTMLDKTSGNILAVIFENALHTKSNNLVY